MFSKIPLVFVFTCFFLFGCSCGRRGAALGRDERHHGHTRADDAWYPSPYNVVAAAESPPTRHVWGFQYTTIASTNAIRVQHIGGGASVTDDITPHHRGAPVYQQRWQLRWDPEVFIHKIVIYPKPLTAAELTSVYHSLAD